MPRVRHAPHALTQDPADDVTSLLLGLPTNAQQLAWSIWDHLFDNQQDEPDEVRVLKAEFGIYGALPVLEVTFDQGFILIDGLTGEAFGPYSDGQPYDPIPLLSNHPEYQAGTPASLIVAETGCEPVQSARWRTNPPPGPGWAPRPGQLVPCPTPQNPQAVCPRGPLPYMPPTPPLQWPEYPYRISPLNVYPPYPFPPIPTRRNPGVDGNPTDWSCVPLPSQIQSELCWTITQWCPVAGVCVDRVIICAFVTPPGRNNTPPVPGTDYPTSPPPLTVNPGGTPGNGNMCIDRFYY